MIAEIYEKKLRKDLFILSVCTLATVVIWIGLTIYWNLTKSRVNPDVKKQILPLTPTIELDTMESIKQRLLVPEASWSSIKLKPVVPVIIEVPEATESALEATESASE